MSTPIKHCAASVMHTKVWSDMRARQAAVAGRGSGNKVGISHAEEKRKTPLAIKEAAYEKQSNGKGEYKNRGNKKILPVKYTPDFVGKGFIIECKGRANESFPMRWKMFKKYVKDNLPSVTLYKPQNQKDCDETIKLIQNEQ